MGAYSRSPFPHCYVPTLVGGNFFMNRNHEENISYVLKMLNVMNEGAPVSIFDGSSEEPKTYVLCVEGGEDTFQLEILQDNRFNAPLH